MFIILKTAGNKTGMATAKRFDTSAEAQAWIDDRQVAGGWVYQIVEVAT